MDPRAISSGEHRWENRKRRVGGRWKPAMLPLREIKRVVEMFDRMASAASDCTC